MVKRKRGRPPGSKNKMLATRRGRPLGSKNKVRLKVQSVAFKSRVTDQITLGQLGLRIMECMSELRRIADGLSGAYQSISQITDGVNSVNNKIVKQIQIIESKVSELEKLVLGKMPSLGDNKEVEQ